MLRERAKQRGHARSGGGMVAIARALTMLILDAPTLGLARVILSKPLTLHDTTDITVLLGEQASRYVTLIHSHADGFNVIEHTRFVWEGAAARLDLEMSAG